MVVRGFGSAIAYSFLDRVIGWQSHLPPIGVTDEKGGRSPRRFDS
jgi:hypothetical protein